MDAKLPAACETVVLKLLQHQILLQLQRYQLPLIIQVHAGH